MSTRSIRKVGAVTALVTSGIVAGGVLAGSMTASAATPTPAPGSTSSSPARGLPDNETVIADSTKLAAIKAAVLAKYPNATFGTISTESAGGYEARITTAAGQHLDVLLDTAYKVTGTETHTGGHGDPAAGSSGTTSG